MNQGILATKSSKTQYSEQEAAKELGITVEELRTLVRSHIAESDDDLNNISVASFHPSDLLVLKLLSGVKANPTQQGSEAYAAADSTFLKVFVTFDRFGDPKRPASLLPFSLMANLGFLGLGLMGYAMARNLARGGHNVAVWSHTSAKAKQLAAEEKATACASPKEVAEHAEFVCACVGDTAMAEQVFLGPQGVIHGAKPGTVVADASTIAPSASRAIGETFASKGIEFLDAPCTGSTPGANAGTLTFMIGGKQHVFEQKKPLFELMGKRFFYCGGPGKGLQAKLTQNLILANLMQAFNEGMTLSTKGGVDPALMLEILDNSAAKSGLIAYKAPFVFKRDFTTNFSTKWMHKDIGLAIDSAEEMGLPMPITSLTKQMFLAAISEGYGELDMCATVRVMERWAGVEVKPK